MRVVRERQNGVVFRVRLFGDDGEPIAPVCQFLDHLVDSGRSPNTACAYAHDLKYLFTFLAGEDIGWREFRPAVAMRFLKYLRRAPSSRSAQRLGLAPVVGGTATEPQRLLAPSSVRRILAGVSAFYDWAIAAEEYDQDENPMLRRLDPALARVPDRHGPFAGRASRQRPMRRVVNVRVPRRLPRPFADNDVEALLGTLTRLRDLAIFLLMLDGGLRPGETLSLHLDDISYGHRRVAVRKRDDHPKGARSKSRTERVVDLHESRTLDAVSRYVMYERPTEAETPFLFLVGGKGSRRCEPLSYDAVARLFARRLDALGIRTPDKTPHALRHTHATAMWEGGMRELTLQRRLGHASPESIRIYTRVSDATVVQDYVHALRASQ